MTDGAKVVLFGKTAATVLGVSGNGKRLHVKYDACGKTTWTNASNAKAVA